MDGTAAGIRERLADLRSRVAAAAARSARSPRDVTILGAGKLVPADTLAAAIAAGLEDLGENRVQEAVPKIEALGRAAVRWHLIGHLQRNKAGKAVEWFDRVHGLDQADTARALSARAAAVGRRMPSLIEVNVSGEATKHGVAPGDLERMLEAVGGLPGLQVDGLMTLARPAARAEDARPEFARLRELRDRAERSLGRSLPVLSMGMSADYEVAIEEGATLVRIGTALFGPRD